MTSMEYLSWCKARAEEYLKANKPDVAFLSFVSDLAKHPKTGVLLTLDKIREGNAFLLAERLTNPERCDLMRDFIKRFELSFLISFADARIADVYVSMCEGMEEVRRDDQENDIADLMDALGRHIWGNMRIVVPGASISMELSMELHKVALDVLENCLDNSSGMKPEDDGAEDYIFIGDITIDPEKPE